MVHLGNNIARLRGFRRLGQKDIYSRIGMSQQEYSKLEKKEIIDDDLLEKISTAIDFPVELIKSLNDNNTVQNVYQNEGNNGNGFYITNPIDKLMELYERLLKEKDETIRQKDEVIGIYKKQQKEK